MKHPTRIALFAVTAVLVMMTGSSSVLAAAMDDQAPGRTMAQQAIKDTEIWITADHTQHDILKQPFTSGEEVTAACLTCHNEAASQIHKTIHWTWMDPNTTKDKKLGKGGLSINNF